MILFAQISGLRRRFYKKWKIRFSPRQQEQAGQYSENAQGKNAAKANECEANEGFRFFIVRKRVSAGGAPTGIRNRRRYTQISKGNQKPPIKKGNPVNEEIKANELRVIDSDGEQAGVMLREVALDLADRKGLDLVLISPNADPPVAKIMDYGKYRYDQQKREKEAKKKQKIVQVKEIRLSTFIDSHDLEVKSGAATRFLKDGDKLKVSLRFKGRERGRTERGFEVMERFSESIKEYGLPEKRPSMEGRSLTMIVNPLPPKKEKQVIATIGGNSDGKEQNEIPQGRDEAHSPDGDGQGKTEQGL